MYSKLVLLNKGEHCYRKMEGSKCDCACQGQIKGGKGTCEFLMKGQVYN